MKDRDSVFGHGGKLTKRMLKKKKKTKGQEKRPKEIFTDWLIFIPCL